MVIAEPVIISEDTTYEAGDFIEAAYSYFSDAQKKKLEAVLFGLGSQKENEKRYIEETKIHFLPLARKVHPYFYREYTALLLQLEAL